MFQRSRASKATAALFACLIFNITGVLKFNVAVAPLLKTKFPLLSEPDIVATVLTCDTNKPPPKSID